MILEIVKYGNPVLREKGRKVKDVDETTRQLAEDMLETMRAAHGVGLAAQQVGVPIQLTVIDVAGIEDRPSAMWIDGKEVAIEEHMPLVLLNPVLKLSEEKETANEGCLSFPDHRGDYPQHRRTLHRPTARWEKNRIRSRGSARARRAA
jgi:peptide deformylase